MKDGGAVSLRSVRTSAHSAYRRFALFAAVMVVFFAKSLLALGRLAFSEELHSHIILIPFVSAYLLWLRWRQLPHGASVPSPQIAMLVFVGASATWVVASMWEFAAVDHLSFMALSFVAFLIGGGFLFLGSRWMRAAAFPVAFLLFFVPLPNALVYALETASKLASAEATDLLFSIAGVPFFRDGETFTIPGITLRVAQECSGIRSSVVLLITGIFASNLLLQTAWRRWVLVLFVIPLGVIRNGFRILVLGLLCVNYGPEMIDSPIHHRGGPLFFGLSLIPFLFIVWWLRRGETRALRRAPQTAPAS